VSAALRPHARTRPCSPGSDLRAALQERAAAATRCSCPLGRSRCWTLSPARCPHTRCSRPILMRCRRRGSRAPTRRWWPPPCGRGVGIGGRGAGGRPNVRPLLAPVTMPSGLSPAAWLGFAVLKACPTVVLLSLAAGPCERVAADGRGQWRITCAACCEIVWGCQRA